MWQRKIEASRCTDGMRGYKYQSIPTIILKGNWLKELGFNIGAHISISCENGRLVITPDIGKDAFEKAESELIEREMESLQKRFEVEKRKLHLQFAAKRKAGYGICEG